MLSSLYACEPMSVGIYVHYVNKKNWLKNFSYRKKKLIFFGKTFAVPIAKKLNWFDSYIDVCM